MPDGRGSEESTIFVAGLPNDMTNLEMSLGNVGGSQGLVGWWGWLTRKLQVSFGRNGLGKVLKADGIVGVSVELVG